MSIRDDYEDVDATQLTISDSGRTSDFGNVSEKKTEYCQYADIPDNSLVVNSSTMETQGESPKCMYHLLSPTVLAKTPVDPRFSTDKPPRVRMILPELNRGRYQLCIF